MFRRLCVLALFVWLVVSCTTEGNSTTDEDSNDTTLETFVGTPDTHYTKDTGQITPPQDTSTTGQDGTTQGDTPTGNDPYAAARQACVDEINRHRATEGKSPLERWTDAEFCTDGEAKSDSETGIPHGAFGQCNEHGQNECPGWPSTDSIISGCLQAMWDEGPPPVNPCEGQCFLDHGHYINMSSTRFTKVACGFYTTPDGSIWSIQNFR